MLAPHFGTKGQTVHASKFLTCAMLSACIGRSAPPHDAASTAASSPIPSPPAQAPDMQVAEVAPAPAQAQAVAPQPQEVDCIPPSELTPLGEAAAHGDVMRLKKLLHQGTAVDQRSGCGPTPVMIALSLSLGEPYKPETARARRKGQLKCAALLLEAGADVHATDGRGYSALHHAAFSGDGESSILPLLTQILAKGADVNARTHAGMTPLGLAEERGHEQVAAAFNAAATCS